MQKETSAFTRLAALLFLAMILLVVAVEFSQRSNLAKPMPLVLSLIGAIVGGLVGWLPASGMKDEPTIKGRFQRLVVIVGFPLGGILAGTYLARALFLQVAFQDVPTKPAFSLVVVESIQSKRRRLSNSWLNSNQWLNVYLPGGERRFRVLVDDELIAEIGPRPTKGKHCLALPVEEGKWGYKRVIAPNYSDKPLGVEYYRECRGS